MATNASEECHDLICDPCSENDMSRPADKYCQVCDELLCHTCVRVHLRNVVLKSHSLNDNISASFKRKGIHPLALCDKHKTEKVEHYCENHNVLCCCKCRLVTHSTCKITAIKTKSQTENQSKLIKNTLQHIQNLQQKVKRIKATHENDIKSLKTNKDQCFTEVKAIKKELDDLFIKLEKEVLHEIVQKEANIKSQIDEHIAKSEHLLHQLNDCKDTLEDCESTTDDELMFIGLDKSRDEIDTMAKLIAELQDIIITTELQFEAQEDVKNMRKTIKKLGDVKSEQPMRQAAQATGTLPRVSVGVNVTSQSTSDEKSATSTRKRQVTARRYTPNVLGVTASSQRLLDVNTNWITGSTFLETGELVLCDRANSKLLLFSSDLSLKGELKLSGQPFDVAAITERRVAVTKLDGDQLTFVDTTPTMSVTNKTTLKSGMLGIVSRSQLYVLVNGGFVGKHDILVVRHDGRQVKTINLSAVGIKWPEYIAVNRDESRVFVSDGCYPGTNSVSCLNCQSGTELFRFRSEKLSDPRDLFVDHNNVLMICWAKSWNITVVTAEGRLENTLLSSTDGLESPLTVTFRPRDRTLVVGMNTSTSPVCRVFRLKSK